MLWLYYWLRGYLRVNINGTGAEKLLNIAAANRISFRDLHYKSGKISGCIPVSSFKELRTYGFKSHARLHITERHGLPFLLNKYHLRIGFFAGAALFFCILYFMSMFVWRIDVVGNKNVSEKDILAACNQLGIYEGSFKKRITPKVDAQKLLLEVDGLAWASLNIEGCVLTVDVTEIRNEQIKGEEPCNICASFDGIIKKLDVTSGNALVSVGDVVRKGDILVSGINERAGFTEFVVSSGEVIAETERTFTAERAFKDKVAIKTGKIKKRTVFSFFGLDIPLYLGNVKGDYISDVKVRSFELFGKGIPIEFTTKKFIITEQKDVVYTYEELSKMLEDEIIEEIEKSGIKEYELLSNETQNTTDGIKVVWHIKANENIASFEKILLDSKN